MKVNLIQSLSSLPVVMAHSKGYFQQFGIDIEIETFPSFKQLEYLKHQNMFDCMEIHLSSLVHEADREKVNRMNVFPGLILSYSNLGFYSRKNIWELETSQNRSLVLPVPDEYSPERYYGEILMEKLFSYSNFPYPFVAVTTPMLKDIYLSENCLGMVGDPVLTPFLTRNINTLILRERITVPNTILVFSKSFLETNREAAVNFILGVRKGIKYLMNSSPEEIYRNFLVAVNRDYYQFQDLEDYEELFLTYSQLLIESFSVDDTEKKKKNLIYLMTDKMSSEENCRMILHSFHEGMNNLMDQRVFHLKLNVQDSLHMKLGEKYFNEDEWEEAVSFKSVVEFVSDFGVDLYQILFRNGLDSCLIYEDGSLEITDLNHKFKEFYGYTRKDFDDMVFSDLIHNYNEDNPIYHFVYNPEPKRYLSNVEFIKKDGVVVNVDMHIFQIHSSLRVKYLVLIYNNNERKEMLRLKHEFISNINHELRTPLTSIIGYIELLAMDETLQFKDEHIKNFDIIERNLKRMRQLVENLLKLDSFGNALQKSNVEVFEISEVINDVFLINEPLAQQKNLVIRAKLLNGIYIKANKFEFTQIITNLVGNAVKYTENGGIMILMDREINNLCSVKVIDTGMGIDKKYLESIFDRFFRVPTEKNIKIGGTGLGLSITKELLNKMGGSIMVDSALGVGTTFTIMIPIEKVEN